MEDNSKQFFITSLKTEIFHTILTIITLHLERFSCIKLFPYIVCDRILTVFLIKKNVNHRAIGNSSGGFFPSTNT